MAANGNGKYARLIATVVDNVGGEDNVTLMTHCVTRLRFSVKDMGLVKADEIEKTPGVLKSQWVGDQYQVVIGGAVQEVYDEVLAAHPALGMGADAEKAPEPAGRKRFSIGALFDVISGCVAPLIPVLMAGGMIKVILTLCSLSGLLAETDSTYVILGIVSDASLYFLPVFVGAFAAMKFHTNVALGLIVGAMLLHPSFLALVDAGDAMTFFGIPIQMVNYSYTLIPVMLSVWVMSYVERFFTKHVHQAIRGFVAPLLTLLVMIPVTFCFVAPIGSILGNYLAVGILWLYEHVRFVAMPLVCAFMPFIVMTGMHMALDATVFQMLASVGKEPFIVAAYILFGMNQGVAEFVVALKNHDPEVRSEAITCAISAIFGGVTEPGIYGITLKYKTPMYAACIGSAFSGLSAAFMQTFCYGWSGCSIFSIASFISGGDLSSFYAMAISIAIGAVVTAIATLVLYKAPEAEPAKDADVADSATEPVVGQAA